ncbi:lysylphosphatidylglycerol synthase transmembrane domain-containing protein [uncultured Sphingomonas sp.]|uniref:lysylphosphatidylglycerol synthase transmembrane domain-containing protein n=1 Tax=uncultured Sphingomonas sp. TaxID=158754 RepID=UPI0025EC2F6D|nr:lysylphosphatidylglycerol synthase transmembrane domain-containing protein [uncultured Sphingomonas sp.]
MASRRLDRHRAAMSSRTERHAGGGWRNWFFGIVLAAALIGAVLHWGEVKGFAALVERARPEWLGLAIALQLSTYASVAAGWAAVLRRAGTPRKFAALIRIAVTKLFADQALPSAGMGGNVLLVDQLRGIGVERGTAVAALIISMIGFYAAYALFAIIMLVLLWFHDRATPLMAGLVTLFLCVALAIPSLALWLRNRGSEPLPDWLEKIGVVRALLDNVAEAPSALLRDRSLLTRVAACNALIFLADAGTLFACLRALGTDASFGTSFIALIMASIVVTLGPIPLGLGSFEATSTATLRLLGISFEAAFAGTMLLRLLILWLPLIPGMILMRGAIRRPRRPMHGAHPASAPARKGDPRPTRSERGARGGSRRS